MTLDKRCSCSGKVTHEVTEMLFKYHFATLCYKNTWRRTPFGTAQWCRPPGLGGATLESCRSAPEVKKNPVPEGL